MQTHHSFFSKTKGLLSLLLIVSLLLIFMPVTKAQESISGSTSHALAVTRSRHGKVIGLPQSAKEGETVSFTIETDPGYIITEVLKYSEYGESTLGNPVSMDESGVYRFTMGDRDTFITVQYGSDGNQDATDQLAIESVMDLIDRVGPVENITINSKATIKYTEEAYNALTEAQKMRMPQDYTDRYHAILEKFSTIESSLPTHKISVLSSDHGQVTGFPETAKKGEEFTFTVKPDKGYQVNTVGFCNNKDKVEHISLINPNESNVYKVIMNDEDIFIIITYQLIPDYPAFDKSELESLIQSSEKLKADHYTVDSWKAFENAYKSAKAAFDDTTITQQAVVDAANALKQATDALVTTTQNNTAGIVVEGLPAGTTLDVTDQKDDAVKVSEAQKAAEASKTIPNAETIDVLFISDITPSIKPDGRVTLKIAVPQDKQYDAYYVGHQNADGSYTWTKVDVKNGIAELTVDSFSTYTVVGVVYDKNSGAGTETGSGTSVGSHTTTSTQASTTPNVATGISNESTGAVSLTLILTVLVGFFLLKRYNVQ